MRKSNKNKKKSSAIGIAHEKCTAEIQIQIVMLSWLYLLQF